MTPGDPIRAALLEACATDTFWEDGDGPADASILRDRACAIAAFLRALPIEEIGINYGAAYRYSRSATAAHELAAAVERAAKEAGGA